MFLNKVQTMLLQLGRVLQMDFPESRDIPSLPSMGAPHRDSELSKQ